MSALKELTDIAHLLPLAVIQDLDKRCGDWLASGGSPDDPYIQQQVRFAKHFLPASSNQEEEPT